MNILCSPSKAPLNLTLPSQTHHHCLHSEFLSLHLIVQQIIEIVTTYSNVPHWTTQKYDPILAAAFWIFPQL